MLERLFASRFLIWCFDELGLNKTQMNINMWWQLHASRNLRCLVLKWDSLSAVNIDACTKCDRQIVHQSILNNPLQCHLFLYCFNWQDLHNRERQSSFLNIQCTLAPSFFLHYCRILSLLQSHFSWLKSVKLKRIASSYQLKFPN